MKKIVTIFMLVAILAGCSGGKEVTITGKGNVNGVTSEVEIVSKGDKVSKEKAVVVTELKNLGLTEEQAKQSMEVTTKAFNEIEGLSCKVETDSTTFTMTTEIDYSKADIEALKKIGLVDSTSDADFVSLKLTKAGYEKTYGVVFEEK